MLMNNPENLSVISIIFLKILPDPAGNYLRILRATALAAIMIFYNLIIFCHKVVIVINKIS